MNNFIMLFIELAQNCDANKMKCNNNIVRLAKHNIFLSCQGSIYTKDLYHCGLPISVLLPRSFLAFGIALPSLAQVF